MLINVIVVSTCREASLIQQEVKETGKFFKPVEPIAEQLDKQMFRKTEEYTHQQVNAKTMMFFGRELKPLVEAYCKYVLPDELAQEFIRMHTPCIESEETTDIEKTEMPDLPEDDVAEPEKPIISTNSSDILTEDELAALDKEEESVSTGEATSASSGENVADVQDKWFMEQLSEFDTTFCESCHKTLAIDDPVIAVNEGIDGERYECTECHEKHMQEGSEVQCAACEGIFDAAAITNNRCPSCGCFIPPRLEKHYEPSVFPAEGEITIHTDGSCLTNPGIGGWAAVIQCGETKIELSDGAYQTTNQVMELRAPYEALKKLDELGVDRNRNVKIFSDSSYVVNGIYGSNGNDAWYLKWRKNGWNSSTGPVKNLEHWLNLITLFEARKPHIKAVWVKGHAGNPMNERCDTLASKAAMKFRDAIQD